MIPRSGVKHLAPALRRGARNNDLAIEPLQDVIWRLLLPRLRQRVELFLEVGRWLGLGPALLADRGVPCPPTANPLIASDRAADSPPFRNPNSSFAARDLDFAMILALLSFNWSRSLA